MTKLVGSHYFQVRAFRGAHGPFFVVVEVCVARYSGGTREKGVCESSTSSVERATVSVVVALEVDDDICVTAGNLPEPQRRDAAPLIEALMKARLCWLCDNGFVRVYPITFHDTSVFGHFNPNVLNSAGFRRLELLVLAAVSLSRKMSLLPHRGACIFLTVLRSKIPVTGSPTNCWKFLIAFSLSAGLCC